MKKLMVFFGIFLMFMVGVQAQTLALPPHSFLENPIVTTVNAWFKYFHFPDGTSIEADTINDHAFIENHSEECFRVSGDQLTDTIHFALNPACIRFLPIYITEPYGKWGFNTETPTHDFTFQCNDWVCELGLWTAWNEYYQRQEHATLSQDFDDLAIVTTTDEITLATSEYSLTLPVEAPSVGDCLRVATQNHSSYTTVWADC